MVVGKPTSGKKGNEIMTTKLPTTTIINIPINDTLASIGILKFTRQYDTLQLTFNNERIVIFDIHPKGYLKTIENLKVAAKNEKIDNAIASKLAFILCNEFEEYFRFLQNENGRIDGDGHNFTISDIQAGDITDTDDTLKALPTDDEDGAQKSQAQKALEIVAEKCSDLFLDQFGSHYAAVRIGEHIETLQLKSSRFKNWVCKRYYESEGDIINSENVTSVLNILKARAEFDGQTRSLHLRIAFAPDSTEPYTILYDLSNKDWQAVKVTPENDWTIENAPILFRRYSNQQPQAYPSREYPPDIFDQFMHLINVGDNDNKLLLKCYIIALFIPEIPKPVLMLHGEQGSAKSTLQELIKMLIDPSSILTVTFPRDINELVQKLMHNYICYFDNVSEIKEWISDQLCRAVTGSGFSKRELYSDDDDVIYNFRRCIGFNGINLGATKADLLDRGIIIKLERLPKENQRRLEIIWREFEKIKAQVLGYIFDILVRVLQIRKNGSVEIRGYPRMADFAEIGEIISRCMGYANNEFLDAYYKNIRLQAEEAIDAHPIGTAIVILMEGRLEWIGSATELLSKLEDIATQHKINIRDKLRPKTPNWLSRRINEVKTNLREKGIAIEKDTSDNSNKRLIIRKIHADPENCKISTIPPVSTASENHAQNQAESAVDIDGVIDVSTTAAKMSTGISTGNHIQDNSSVDIVDRCDIIRSSQKAEHGNAHTNGKTVNLSEITNSMKIGQGYQARNNGFNFNTIISLEQFFNNDPDQSNQTIQTHSLEESPCYPIINSKIEGRYIWYYCKLHPDFKNISLSSIEHHCRYHEPDRHKAEILKLISRNQELHRVTESSSDDLADLQLNSDLNKQLQQQQERGVT